MKQISTFFISMLVIAAHGQNFTPGNLVVSRVGDGAITLGTGTAPVSLLEFNKTTADQAAPLKTVSIGSTTGASKLTLSGTTVFEGQFNLSQNGQYLSVLGYDVPAGELATNTGITGIAVSAGGMNYTFSSVITISGGGGTGATATINSIGTGGVITGIRMTNSGSGYTSTPTVSITIGTGFTAGTIARVPYWQGISSKKVVGRIDNTGAVDYSTKFSNSAFAGGVSKNAVSVDGSKYWLNSGSRIEYVTFGQTTDALQVVSAGPRVINIFNSQLYYMLGFNNNGLNFTNPALPEATATTTVVPVALTASISPGGFMFFDLDNTISWNGTGFDVLYIAETNSGLEKYYFDGTNWVPANSKNAPLAAPLNNALFPGSGVATITGELNSMGQPIIYAVSGNGSATANKIYAISDASGRTGTMVLNTNTTAVTLATAPANFAYRGIAFAPSVTVLPIQLTAFNGSLINGKTSLKWITSSEVNANEYVVERSNNGNSFTTIGKVAAKNSNQINSYDFEDAQPNKGNNYYRIKMTDKDGSFKYSKVVVINLNDKLVSGLTIFPNPVVNGITISHAKADAHSMLKIVSAKGEIMVQYNVAQNATQTSVDASALPPGQYFINFMSNGKSVTRAFVK